MEQVNWRIDREGKSWSKETAFDRYDLAPDKIEMIEGKLFWNDDQRRTMLALLLENLGVDEAVKLGELGVWQAAIDARRDANDSVNSPEN